MRDVSETYNENTDLITIFSEVCQTVDSLEIAAFFIKADNDAVYKILDFKYDFTSVMPELIELQAFLTKGNDQEFILYLYEIDLKISFLFDVEYDTDIKVVIKKSNEQIVKEYPFNSHITIKSIETTLETFGYILRSFFPVAHRIFKKEKYLIL